jgi:hypothetical protein
MKRLHFIIFALIVLPILFSVILSTSCESPTETMQDEDNQLVLVSQGITYQLVEHWVYSVENGVCADGKWFDKLALEMDSTLSEDLAAAKEIPYADDFSFMQVGLEETVKMDELSFNIYDENLEKIVSDVKVLNIPDENGLYYVAVFVSWGENDNCEGYQYLFKTRK